MCGLETSTSRSSDGMQVYYAGTCWVVQAMAQSGLSFAKGQSIFGYRNAESFVRSKHVVRLIVCTRHLNDGLRCFAMSECPETHDPTSRTPAPCATAVPGVGTFSNINRERLVGAKRTRVTAHCEEDGRGNARLLRNLGGPAATYLH